MSNIQLPSQLGVLLSPDAPQARRLLAAKGLFPVELDSLTLVHAFFVLSRDADAEVAAEAAKSLCGLPVPVLVEVCHNEKLAPQAMQFFVLQCLDVSEVIIALLGNRNLHPLCFAMIAERCSANIASIVVSNQEMFRKHPKLLQHLRKNPVVSRAQLVSVASFLYVAGAVKEDEVADLLAVENSTTSDAPEFPSFLINETGEGGSLDPDSEEYKKLQGDIAKSIRDLSIGQKVRLALTGNAASRGFLIKDTNKMVAQAVLKNGRVTESEVVKYTKYRDLIDEVIRGIASRKEWVKNYAVRVNLVVHPKTPTAQALGFVKTLRTADLRRIAKDRNVPGQISKMAKILSRSKGEQ